MAKQLECEICCLCQNQTGKAGRADGSIFSEVVMPFSIDTLAFDVDSLRYQPEVGPLCSACHAALMQLMVIEE